MDKSEFRLYKVYKFNANNYLNHKILKEIFPGDGKVLYRRMQNHLLVLTNIRQSFDDILIKDIGECDINNYGNFNIRLNIFKRSRVNNKLRLKPDADYVNKFVKNKLDNMGIEYNISKIISEGALKSEKKGCNIYHHSFDIYGTYNVTNQSLFEENLFNGIGYGKCFGFGLFNVF